MYTTEQLDAVLANSAAQPEIKRELRKLYKQHVTQATVLNASPRWFDGDRAVLAYAYEDYFEALYATARVTPQDLELWHSLFVEIPVSQQGDGYVDPVGLRPTRCTKCGCSCNR